MTLQSSGAISIAQMRDEYGLSNPISMSDFYGKNGLPTNGTIRFSDFYGKSNFLDQQIVTVAKWDDFFDVYGYSSGRGSISDGTSNIFGGIAITKLCWMDNFDYLYFSVASNVSNSAWTTMTVNGTTYNRTDANFSSNKEWRWSTGTNPFGTTVGAQITVTWL